MNVYSNKFSYMLRVSNLSSAASVRYRHGREVRCGNWMTSPLAHSGRGRTSGRPAGDESSRRFPRAGRTLMTLRCQADTGYNAFAAQRAAAETDTASRRPGLRHAGRALAAPFHRKLERCGDPQSSSLSEHSPDRLQAPRRPGPGASGHRPGSRNPVRCLPRGSSAVIGTCRGRRRLIERPGQLRHGLLPDLAGQSGLSREARRSVHGHEANLPLNDAVYASLRQSKTALFPIPVHSYPH